MNAINKIKLKQSQWYEGVRERERDMEYERNPRDIY